MIDHAAACKPGRIHWWTLIAQIIYSKWRNVEFLSNIMTWLNEEHHHFVMNYATPSFLQFTRVYTYLSRFMNNLKPMQIWTIQIWLMFMDFYSYKETSFSFWKNENNFNIKKVMINWNWVWFFTNLGKPVIEKVNLIFNFRSNWDMLMLQGSSSSHSHLNWMPIWIIRIFIPIALMMVWNTLFASYK